MEQVASSLLPQHHASDTWLAAESERHKWRSSKANTGENRRRRALAGVVGGIAVADAIISRCPLAEGDRRAAASPESVRYV